MYEMAWRTPKLAIFEMTHGVNAVLSSTAFGLEDHLISLKLAKYEIL
jgi:hypothetical protein